MGKASYWNWISGISGNIWQIPCLPHSANSVNIVKIVNSVISVNSEKILLAPKASEASMGAFYFWERVNDCCNKACGYCYAIAVQHTEVPNLGASW